MSVRLFERPLTAAERQARYRAKRGPVPDTRTTESRRESASRWNRSDACKAAKARYRSTHKSERAAQEMQRQARKKCASPLWANQEEIGIVYQKAREFGLQVDHVVPLQSDIVCGLHVHANLQLLHPFDNRSKLNRHWPDMP